MTSSRAELHQRKAALARAQAMRRRRGWQKRRLSGGFVSLPSILLSPPASLQRLTVVDLLTWVRWIGPTRATEILKRARVREDAPLGELTPRHRQSILYVIRRDYPRVWEAVRQARQVAQPNHEEEQMLYRQGDVLIRRIDKLPDRPLKQVKGRKILAEGEVTGHVHEVIGDAELFVPEDLRELEECFLRVEEEVEVRHAEHGTITLPPGIHQVSRQREYSPEQTSIVGD
jgi:hypothetical protein